MRRPAVANQGPTWDTFYALQEWAIATSLRADHEQLLANRLAEALRAEEDLASEALSPKAQAALAAWEEARSG